MAVKIYHKEIRTILLGNTEINYELARKSVKNINLRMNATGQIKVSASQKVPISCIEGFLREKQHAILTAVQQAQIQCVQKQEQSKRAFVDGESLLLLGRQFIIKVIISQQECVYPENGYLYFHIKNPKDTRRRELLYAKWLKSYQQQVYKDIAHQVHQIFVQYGVDFPEIKVRKMTSRWGSCCPKKGIITMNSCLIETPICCIEYVMMHEFCHFIHPDHSKAFYTLMTKFMPDWKERKRTLNAITDWN
ncbi:hypothetical protein IMSAGC011_01680 [Lachnospiraceae bacterium]|nr:hypothetical protein IMSAGC011_01680 [Lachnospiraceae bacterium]